ncbi:creatininase family protein [Vallitalea okinawensis]|uniref:creatininase family protein n=1 Tax=Vallitalea okinawensis TaxID=2078660 RepID=UPI000CFCE219|nr:creatininase family protein [Vallitalea okinawensis]
MRLDECTWKELKSYTEKQKGLIIPIGTCEQHGHHLPLNTDVLVCEYFSKVLSEESGMLIAPTINYGVNLSCDKNYTGTTSISAETLTQTVKEIVQWWQHQGFKDFYLLSYHGEPKHIQALKTIHNKCHVLELYEGDYEGILEKQNRVMHACEGETSLMMFLYPDRVRENMMTDFYMPEEEFDHFVANNLCFDTDKMPGNHGYATAATKEKGRMIADTIKENMMKWYNINSINH